MSRRHCTTRPRTLRYADDRYIDATVKAYLKAGVPAAKYTMGLPLYAVGWTGVSNANHGLYQNATAPSPVLLADGSGECPNPDKAHASPGCDTILTAGFATYSTIENLTHRERLHRLVRFLQSRSYAL